MLISSWLKSLRTHLQPGTRRSSQRRYTQAAGAPRVAMPQVNEALEERVLLAAPQLIKIASTNTGSLISTNPSNPDTLPIAPEQFTLSFNPGQVMDVASARDGITVTDSLGAEVNVGFVGAGASPEEIVVRFAENLTDGRYFINIDGTVQNAGGEAFNNGSTLAVPFDLDLGAQVVAVVPQPVTTSGGITQARNQIVVHFNDDDLDATRANMPQFYQLINAEPNPVNPNDTVRLPQSVVYNAASDSATLTFASNIEDLFAPGESLFRLRVGTNEAPPATPTAVGLTASATTTFDYLTDEDSDGVNEFVEVNFVLADPAPGTSQDGKPVQINITANPAATVSTPVVTADVTAGSIDIALSSGAGFETTLAELLASMAGNADVGRLVRVEVMPNSNLAAEIGASLTGTQSILLADAGSSFRTGNDLGDLGTGPITVSSAIEPQAFPFDFPGALDEPGQREIDIFRFVPSFDSRYHPSFVDQPFLSEDSLDVFPFDFVDPGIVDGPGVETLFYNFQTFVGLDPEGRERTNIISEPQKQRVREVFDFYANYLGVQFVETANRGFTIARSDMRVLNGEFFAGANDGIVGVADPARQLAILDSGENWNDTFTDYTDPRSVGTVNFFEESMEVIGLLLGLGNTDHAPGLTVQGQDNIFYTTGNTNLVELDYPGDIDIVGGRFLHPPESKDIDLYRFEVTTDGAFTAEIFAERLTGADTSQLDATLRLYRVTESTPGGTVVESTLVAQNDDYFSEDSFIDLNLTQGVYFIGVSASGNDDYNPALADTGINGRTQGKYELNLNFRANVGAANSLTDNLNSTPLDGDHDGVAGGVANFWFKAVQENQTFFVNRTEAISTGNFNTLPNGSRVYNEIDLALADASAGTIVRIVGNDTDAGYEIGPGLRDGNHLLVPKDVTVMVDGGAILKLDRARIGVGSFDQVTDRSGGSLQVLGTPEESVIFTSWRNENIGGDTTPTPTTPENGDWGGIIFQENIDRATPSRTVLSDQGVFMDYVAFGEFTYGGGRLNVGSTEQTVNPIYTVSARPTILHNTIVHSNDSAISADPDSFAETRFSDYTRVGPEIYGNILSESTDNLAAVNTVDTAGDPITVQNASNGLFVRILTPAGDAQTKLTVAARFDDTDITHILTENLEIQGTPGGRLDPVTAPELDRALPSLTTLTSTGVGDLPEGTYSYRMTFVTRDAGNMVQFESPPSDPSDSHFITGDPTTGSAIRLTSLPTATGQFNGRRLYRSHDGVVFTLVAELNASTTTFVDDQFASGRPLDTRSFDQSLARYDARLTIDPGIIIKAEDAAIQVGIGAQLIAEGKPGREIIFTSRKDDSFGAGGTFDTNDDASIPTSPAAAPGDWGGIFVGHLSSASISDALVTFGGGSVPVPGGFATFNAIEIHQAQARIVNTILENNADGTGLLTAVHRLGRGPNGSAVIFVRGAQPILADNIIRNNDAPALSINANSLNHEYVYDWGRSRGEVVRIPGRLDNQGPLLVGNTFDGNTNNGMMIRGEVLTTQSVWDDTSVVHVLDNEHIVVPDVITYGGLRLESSATSSLIVKLDGPNAGFTAAGRPLDIDDRIGGVLHVIGQPGRPVVLTSLHDDSVGAGLNADGLPQNDTNGNGIDANNDGVLDNAVDADADNIDDVTGLSTLVVAASPGDWSSITIDQFAHDRNVTVHVESESRTGNAPGINSLADNAEPLGELAPLEDIVNAGDLAPLTGPSNPLRGGGDETLRLGFEVQGVLNEINDVDVYSFLGTVGSEVWIDIDRSRHSLDTVVDLIDLNNNILASTDSTLTEQTGLFDVFESTPAVASGLKAHTLNKSLFNSDDFFSTNQRDAGMRVVLPGGAIGARSTFYVRVRSSSIDPLDTAANRNELLTNVAGGQTAGAYQLQIRLQEEDEVPGSTVRYADIRFAENGIRILGQPTHSPLQGEFFEDPSSDVSNTRGGAPNLGNVLNTDQGSISISAALQRENDIDWFRFDVTPDSVRDDAIENPGGPLVFEGGTPIIFDIDYADDNGGANTRLSIFNSAGQLILYADDSNITDDRPAGNEPGGDVDDKSRGSVGSQDPYIGPFELPAGTYFAAVTSSAMIPNALEYLIQEPGGALDEVRLEPVNSIRRIADERFSFGPDEIIGIDQATAAEPIVDLFDEETLFNQFGVQPPSQPNIVPWDLSDVALYISTAEGIAGTTDTLIRTVDAYSGVTETVVGPRVSGVQPVGDIAMRHDGELFGFAVGPANGGINDANTQDYLRFSTADGSRSDQGGTGITTWFRDAMNNPTMGGNNNSGVGFNIEGVAYYTTGDSGGIFIGHRNSPGTQTTDPMNDNVLFFFNVDSGRAANTAMDISTMNGFHADFEAGTIRPAIGFVDTVGDGTTQVTGGLGGRITGIAYPDFGNSRGYGITDAGGLHAYSTFSTDFVADNGSVVSSFIGDIGSMIGRPGLSFQGLAAGPDDIEPLTDTSFQGRYEDILFAISEDGLMVAIDISNIFQNGTEFTGEVSLAPIFVNGQTTLQITDEDGAPVSGVTGLDFGTLTRNLWHVTSRDIDDDGHGAETPIDFSRDNTDDGLEGSSNALFFGNDRSGSVAGNKNNRGRNNTIDDVYNIDFPNGAHGSILSNEFDLSPYTADDKPVLEFNYYLQTEDADARWSADTPNDNDPMRDSFRVFVGGDDGVWNLVATNNSLQQVESNQRIDEFDYAPIDPNDPLDIQEPITDGTGSFSDFPLGQDYPDVVELYDDPVHDPGGNGETWYAARIDLSSYAGRDNLKLRFDFSTAGGMDFADGLFHTLGVSTNDVIDGPRVEELRALPAFDLQDGERFETDGDGNFTDIDAFNAGTTTVTPTGEHFEFDLGHVVVTPSGSSIADGQTFEVDGTIFEFEKTFPAVATNSVSITDYATSGDVANAIAAAVNAAALPGVTAIAVGNRVNFAGATTTDVLASGLSHAGTPGVRAGHHAVDITLDMDRAAVALQIKTTLAETFFIPLATNISEVEPNDTPAEAQSLEGAGWTLVPNAIIGDFAGNDTSETIPHITVAAGGDGTLDLYSFTATAGSRGIFDIDASTNGLDTRLRILQSDGTDITNTILDISRDNIFPLDPGSTPFSSGSTFSFDAFLEVTFPTTDTYIVEVSQFGGGIPLGEGYVLHASIENHELDFDANGNPRPTVDMEPNEAGSEQPLDAAVWTTQPNADFFVPTQPHLTVRSAGDAVASVDRYTFTVPLTGSGDAIVDIDDTIGGLDASLQVFDSVGTLIASNLDSIVTLAGDPGSVGVPTDPVLVFGFGGVAGGFQAALTPGETYTIEVNGATLGSDIPVGGGYDLNLSVDGHAVAVNPAASTDTADPTNIKGWHQQGFIELTGHPVTNNGPLGWSNTLPGDEFGAFGVGVTTVGGWTRSQGALRGVNNRIEGVWLDDIVIGVAERGEMVVNAPAGNDGFRIDTRVYGSGVSGNGDVNRDHPNYTGTPNNTAQLTGAYTLEIRRASEFATNAEDFPIKTFLFRSFEDTDRLSEGITLKAPTVDRLADGMTFVLSDGIDELVFEFNDINVAGGVSGTNVEVPIDPLVDGFNRNSDEVIAQTIAAILNSSTVQNVLDLSATAVDNRIEIFGDVRLVVASDPTLGVTGRIAKNVETTHQVTAVPDPSRTIRNTSQGPFDTFQIQNTSATENISRIVLTLPEGQFFDLRDTFIPASLPGFPLFEGADPETSEFSDSVGATYFSDPALTIPLADGDRTAYISFTDFAPGENFMFNIGVSHYIDDDILSTLLPAQATADSGSRHLIDSEISILFDSARTVSGQFMDSRLINFDNGVSEAVLVPSGLDVTIHDLFGDKNVERQQGQIVIESNKISDSAGYAIVSGPNHSVDPSGPNPAGFATGGGVLPGQGAARTAAELNDLGIVPGVVIENNILIRGGAGGIDFAGDVNGVAPFGRILNNTILGGDAAAPLTASGTGIRIRNNATPTVLNNAVANLATGISIDATSDAADTTIGANLYVDNTNDHGGVATYGAFAASDKQAVNPDWTIGETFVDVAVGNLYPAPGSPLIDSSLDGLRDRSEVITVRDPLGIAESPISAPDLDAFGQRRGDDDAPGTGPGAPGADVRKDRGAIDRVDFENPEATVLFIDSRLEGAVEVLDEQERRDTANAVILSESDTAIGEIGRLAAGAASAVRQFVLRFDDIGIGIDDAPILAAINDPTGTIPSPFSLTQDGVPLVEGVDYTFVWNSNTDEAIFTHLTEFPLERLYTILVDNDPAVGSRADLPVGTADPNPDDGVTGIRDLAGNFMAINQADGTTRFDILLTDGVNDAPINGLPLTRQSVNEDQTLVFSTANGNAITVFDADVHLAADPILTVTLTATNGLLTLGSNANVTFPVGGTGSMEASFTIAGSIADLNAALNGLQYTPTPGYFNLLPGELASSNPDPAMITMVTDDGGRFAPGNIAESDTDTLLIDVLSVNDPPTFDPPVNPAAVDEDSTLAAPLPLITGITTGSPSESTQRVEFTVTTAVLSGNVAFTTAPAITPTGFLSYALAPDTNGTVRLTIVARDFDDSDAGHISASSAPVTIDLVVNPINDAPVFVVDNTVSLDSTEDAGPVGPLAFVSSFAAGPATATDEIDATTFPATAQTTTFMNSAPATATGNLTLDSLSVTGGVLNYEATADTFGSVTFDVWLSDDGPTTDHVNDVNESARQTITITVAPAADDPVAGTPNYVIGAGDDLPLDASSSTDADLAFIGLGVTEQLFYSWDLDNDGTFDIVDSPNSQLIYPWASLSALNVTNPGFTDITLRVTDTYAGTSSTATATLEIRPIDFGDAPASYGTLRADNGASHNIVSGFHLGAAVDSEPEAAVAPAEDGADEDGITFTGQILADAISDTMSSFTANASAAGFLDIWLDLNSNGSFEAGEHLNGGTSYALVAGDNALDFTIAAGTAVLDTNTWVRARFTSVGSVGPVGRVIDGEVEDYQVQIGQRPVDHEDAPATYGAASHNILDGFQLGAAIDSELTGQAPPLSDGADDDGIVFEDGMQADTSVDVATFFTVDATSAGKLDVWLDLDNSGTFEAGEHLNGGVSYDLVVGENRFDYTILAGTAVTGVDTWARARFSSVGGLTPTGRANDGEVEDYQLQISPLRDAVAVQSVFPMWSQTSDLTPLLQWEQATGTLPGSNATYTVELFNAANQLVGFDSGVPTNFIQVSDVLAPGAYTVVVTPFNKAGVQGPVTTLAAFEVVGIAITSPTGDIGDSTPIITWTPIDQTDHYEVEISAPSGALVQQHPNVTSASLELTTPLAIGRYNVRVRAIEAVTGQVGDWSVLQPFVVNSTPVLSAPLGTIATATPVVTWGPIPGAATYDVRINAITDNVNPVVSRNGLNATSTSIIDPLPLGEYTIEIRGVDITGLAGAWSPASTVVVGVGPNVISPNGRVADSTPTVTWLPVLGADTYQVEFLQNGQVLADAADLTGTQYTLPDDEALNIGAYQVRVTATNQPADGSTGGPISAASELSPFSVAAVAVIQLPNVVTYDTTPEVTWTLPLGTELSEVTAELEVFNVATNEVVLTQSDLTQTSFTLTTALDPGEYRFRVQLTDTTAMSGNVVSDWSVPRVVQIGAAPVALGPSNGVGQAPFTRTNEGRPTLTAQQSLAGVTHRFWLASVTEGRAIEVVDNIPQSSYTVAEDLPVGRYRYWVQATTGFGEDSAWSQSYDFEVTTSPVLSPVNPTFNPTPSFSWNSSAALEQPEITSYQVWLNKVDVVPAQVILNPEDITGTQFNVADVLSAGLENGRYKVWVRGFVEGAAAGVGRTSTAWSEGIVFEVGGRPIVNAPADPADNTPLITWSPVDGAESYELYLAAANAIGDPIVRVTDLTTNSYQVTEELGDGAHFAWVRARSTTGEVSPWSLNSNARFTVNPVAKPVISAIAASNDTTPTFTWSSATGAARYEIFVSALASTATAIIRDATITSLSYTATTQLTPGEFRVWVRAIGAGGQEGDWSDPVRFTVLAKNDDPAADDVSNLTLVSLSAANETLQADAVSVRPDRPTQLHRKLAEPQRQTVTEVPVRFVEAETIVEAENAVADAADADQLMSDWDAEIWAEETSVNDVRRDINGISGKAPGDADAKVASGGWMASLAMMTPAMFRRRRQNRDDS